MEKEKILDKMRELRDVRDLQILSKELENINLDVDYKKDLIPVCPNCHSMIHRLEGGEEMTVEEIKSKLMGGDC